MRCNFKESNKTAVIIKVFQGPGIIYRVVNVEEILFSVKSKRIQNGEQNVII